MLSKLTSRLFGSSNERQIKKYKPIIDQINNLENEFSDLSDEQLKLKTKIFKDRLSKNENLKISYQKHLQLSGRLRKEH